MSHKSEIQLLSLFEKGNEEAYSHFYKLFVNDMYAYGISLGAGETIVKDSIQNVFLNIYSSKIQFKSVNHLRYYLLRSMKHRVYDFLKSVPYTITDSLDDYESMNFSVEADVVSDLISEEQQQTLKRKLNEMLSILTNRQREAIYLRYSQELDFPQIAEILNMTVPASRKLISRALQRMREHYTSFYIISLLSSDIF